MRRADQGGRASQVVIRSGRETETEPANWKPLERHIGALCGNFMWMYRENGLEYYKHIETRRYLILDRAGRCFRRQGVELVCVDFRKEFRRVTEALDA
jgi:hypothetical protein